MNSRLPHIVVHTWKDGLSCKTAIHKTSSQTPLPPDVVKSDIWLADKVECSSTIFRYY